MKNRILFFAGILLSTQVFAMGNPAAVFCEDVARGEYVIHSDAKGNQSGVCVIGEAVVSGWTLFSASRLDKEGNPKTEKAKINLAMKALIQQKTCVQAKGRVQKLVGDNNQVLLMCNFSDNSSISVDTLKLDKGNQSRNEVLGLL
ncbi:MAG: hypothetical protein BroJett040_24360 [Oligoflexia bacterium]|nr:MAG: hypothetical protein BroJett040_24360 [Oligoflexia bacterium]